VVIATADHVSTRLPMNIPADEGVDSEPLILGGTSLQNIGKAFACIFCTTRLPLLCQGIPHLFIYIDYCMYE